MSKNQFTNHMEFLGYEFEKMPDEPDTVVGKHDHHGPSMVTNAGGRTILKSYFTVSSNALKKRLQFLEIINELNKKSSIASFLGYDDSLVQNEYVLNMLHQSGQKEQL